MITSVRGYETEEARDANLASVLASAAVVQRLEAETTGVDHDPLLSDLADRYALVLDAIEASDGWATSVRASRAPMTIRGSLDGVEAGLRQMRRTRPLETMVVEVGPDLVVTAPTPAESLRIKAYLVVQRNQVRDYLDVVALADHVGIENAVAVAVVDACSDLAVRIADGSS